MDQASLMMLLVVVSLIVSTIVVIVMVRKQRASQKKALKQLPGPLSALEPGKTLSGVHDAVEYQAHYVAGSKNSPPRLTVSVSCESKGRFKVTRETGFDRFFKRYAVTNEIQTHDSRFDDDFFLQSETGDFVRQFFQSSERRRAVSALFELGYTVVEHDGKVMKSTCSPFHPKDDRPPEFFNGAVSELAVLASEPPVVPEATTFAELGAWKAKRMAAFAIPILGLVVGLSLVAIGFAEFPPLDGFWLFLDSLKYSLPLLLVFGWMGVRLLRGRSTSHYELIVVWALALIGFPLAGVGLETFLNGWLDGSDPSFNTAVVLDKHISRSSKTTDYILVLESWRPGRQTETLEVSSWAYQRVTRTKSEVRVVTKPGRFGFEWRVSYEILFNGAH